MIDAFFTTIFQDYTLGQGILLMSIGGFALTVLELIQYYPTHGMFYARKYVIRDRLITISNIALRCIMYVVLYYLVRHYVNIWPELPKPVPVTPLMVSGVIWCFFMYVLGIAELVISLIILPFLFMKERPIWPNRIKGDDYTPEQWYGRKFWWMIQMDQADHGN